MNNWQLADKLITIGKRDRDVSPLVDAMDLLRAIERDEKAEVIDPDGQTRRVFENDQILRCHGMSKEVRDALISLLSDSQSQTFRCMDLYKQALLYDAPHNFDAFCQYMEINRDDERQFYVPRRPQLLQVANHMERLERGELEILGMSFPPGTGKALANETPVLTRNGWKRHGDLEVGDEVVGLDGAWKKVLAVHPKCMLDRQITFSNGEKIVCHKNHEWRIYNRGMAPLLREQTVETSYIESRKLFTGGGENGDRVRGHRYNIQLPYVPPIIGDKKELPLDPYTLGVWLGDGVGTAPTICCAPADRAVIDRVIANGNKVRWQTVHKTTGVLYFGFDFQKKLKSLGMCSTTHRLPKRIPEEYLIASEEQRLELLEGLLDTDGCLSGSKYHFTTSEESLRDSFLDLLATFGWRACVTTVQPKTSTSGITARKPHYVISFTPNIVVFCTLPRKRNYEPHPQRRIAFTSVDVVNPVEGNCITVEGGMYRVGKTMLPTHNSELALFYLAWIGGREPDLANLTVSHSHSIIKLMHSELRRLLSPKDEYCWGEIFPMVRRSGIDAELLTIDLDRNKRFSTYQFTSLGTSNAGRFRAQNLLYCDDLVPGIEVAMNPEMLDKLWRGYTVDAKQRRQGVVKELHIATRWAMNDVVGRLEAANRNNPKALFLNYPVCDQDGHSLFYYPYNLGYSDEQIKELRENMEDVFFSALYMGEPYEKDGQLYAKDELRRYERLPDREPDGIVAVCDTKTTGTDYCCLPIAYVYGSDYYIDDVVFENFNPDVVENSVVLKLLNHKVQQAQFESNVAGGKMAQVVQERINASGGITSITTKWTQAHKETKIQMNAPWVKQHCLFRAEDIIQGKQWSEYRQFLRQLTSYSMRGNNKHDDAPDAMAQLAVWRTKASSVQKVRLGKRFF